MRAARDLLVHVPLASAEFVFDLGCGPGNSAELLSLRFPSAEIVGLDTSEAMLAHARRRAPQARFVKQDIADWAPDERPDVNFANAAMQFLPDHDVLFLASPRIS
jgi:trans-aconitate 2-methyltransferase